MLLIGAFPPDVTLLDLLLSMTVVGLLLGTAARALGHFYGEHQKERALPTPVPLTIQTGRRVVAGHT
jgi:hypothetical protein